MHNTIKEILEGLDFEQLRDAKYKLNEVAGNINDIIENNHFSHACDMPTDDSMLEDADNALRLCLKASSAIDKIIIRLKPVEIDPNEELPFN